MEFPLGLKRAAVLCILKHGRKLLLLKRLKEPNKDLYTPVGGKLDPFESPLDAALRETWEETGIRVTAMKYCGVLTESAPTKYNWISFVYLAEIPMQDAPPCNEGTLEWIDFDQVPDVPTPKTDWFIYDYVLRGQPFAFSATYDEALHLLSLVEETTATVLR